MSLARKTSDLAIMTILGCVAVGILVLIGGMVGHAMTGRQKPVRPANLNALTGPEWEPVTWTPYFAPGGDLVDRIRTPGGWLVRWHGAHSMAHVPDPDHKWLAPVAPKETP